MRRFVRTLFVKRLAQLTVINDSDLREFQVWRWRAEEGLVRVTAFPYAPGDPLLARDAALDEAKRLHALELAASTICAWCPGFDKTDPKNAGASHGMCPTCQARENAKLDEALRLREAKGVPS